MSAQQKGKVKRGASRRQSSKSRTDVNLTFRSIAQRAPVLMWVCDQDGEFCFTNDKWNAFVGQIGKRKHRSVWATAVNRADRAHYQAIIDQCLTERKTMNIEYRILRCDGEERWVSDHADPYYDEDGSFKGLIGTIMDVTDNRSHLAALRHSHEESQAQERENQLIDTMNSYLQVCVSMKETFPVMDYYVQRIFDGCAGAVYLFNENKTVVEPVATWGSMSGTGKVLDPHDSWALRQGKVHEVAESGQGMLCQFLNEHPANGYISAPIIAQGDMIGMLHVQYAEVPDDFSKDEVEHHYSARRRLAVTTADHLALALVSLKLREALKQQSVKDPLTQLFNRRYMSESLEREFARCRRASWKLSVILVDIDHFKRINDDYGHDAGDMVLKELAEFIRDHMRAEDIACRYGGEEFLLLMPGAKPQEAMRRAEELREGVKRLNIRYQGSRLKNIAISAGVATCPDSGETETAIIKAADRALYQAKESGRDRVCLAVSEVRKDRDAKVQSIKG